MFDAYDFLGDLITGQQPKYAIPVRKEDRIHVQLRMLEELPQTAGKLTIEEKEAFAFCVYYSICIQHFDEEAKTMSNGLVEFTSTEKFKELLDYEKGQRPSFFTENITVKKEGKFGFSKGNPIETTSIPAAYQYLKRLRYKGTPVQCIRSCSCSGLSDHILDAYEITVTTGVLFKRHEIHTVYIDSYASSTSTSAPEGFTLA
ncbi:hypothetical protein [Oscillibacter sp.]|uniref:hypothetical protein n=1 Tax=Oscillibacter sp. TaxID=1945593 RepID=UPI0026039A21|nr:hypothetical protein [Oscillibacter sp.]MDD3347122.1 hypothetical protein [Oscillibacter sp.]